MEDIIVLKNIRCVDLPIGYKLSICPYCGSVHLTGALISENSDEQDPDIVCKKCGHIWN